MIKKAEHCLEILLILFAVILLKILSPAIYEDQKRFQDQKKETQLYLQEKLKTTQADTFPDKYDLREKYGNLTVKDQGNLGTCWAVAASSALEGSLLPEEMILSADHMSLRNPLGYDQDMGGDYTMIMAYLAGWQGPVLEEEDPYGDQETDPFLQPAKHVQEIQICKKASVEEIKAMLMQYHVVQSSIYLDLEGRFSSSIYYNQIEHSYCYKGEEEVNHDICIIGWDDQYPADLFNVKTDRDGAFICQNSWGEEFGEDGIFYVSYEDAGIGKNCIVYSKIEETDNYDHLYQTDLCGWVGMIGFGDEECYFANRFTAQREEKLKAVGFYTVDHDTQYSVYVMDGDSALEHVMLEKEKAHGILANAGYHTIQLDEERDMSEGETVTVIVKVKTPGTDYPVAMEYMTDDYSKNVDLSDGDGYISHNGVIWKGTESEYGCNVCMKIYTAEG